jgi:glycosyltransferase involved in cell wall biosynthesis
VHDFLLDLRGAERVFLEMCEIWPQAPIYTTVYDEEGTEGRFAGREVNTSFLQRLRPTARTFRTLLPLYPAAIESFDLSGYDIVVSSSSAWAHAIICDERTTHLCYCHNPFRYVWNDRDRALAGRNPASRAFLGRLFRNWRQWDWIAAQRVDKYVVNSRATQARVRTYFGREARIVHPPVELARFQPARPFDHYLVLSELMSHKRIDVAVQAFSELGRPLVVAGDGPEARRLRRMAGPSVRFAGRVSDAEAAWLLATARALVLPAVEEFGIAAVESQAAGRPVIAIHAGGALETVREGVTGTFWTGGAPELAAAVEGFDDEAIDPDACVDNARRFDVSAFRESLLREVDSLPDAPPRETGSPHFERRRTARLARRGRTLPFS